MSTDYNVFICHRGPDTKHNVVSVLKGMLNSKGITCFVDYNMDQGTDVNTAIQKAIESSLVHIVILSPNFKTSSWCLNEVLQIMDLQKTTSKLNKPRKVIPVLYDVESLMDLDRADFKRISAAQMERWVEAFKSLQNIEGFKYRSQTAFEWEELENIVSEVEDFLILHDIIPNHCDARTLEIDMRQDYGSVYICHNKKDTQRNVVSVLRGILRSRGIICSITDYEQEGTQMKLDTHKAITNARVHVIFLSERFAASKQCLEEVVKIMNVTSLEVKVLPVFYDVAPSEVRHQIKNSAYDLNNVEGSSDDERKGWADALHRLSLLKGFLYNTKEMFQWKTLNEIATNIEALLNKEALSYDNEQKRGNLYQEILEVLKMEEFNAKDVFFLGVYNRDEPNFADLMVQRFRSQFEAFCVLHNVTEEGSDTDELVRKLFSDLIRKRYEGPLSTGDITMYRSHYEELLQSMRCLVVFDDVGNDTDNIKPLLQLVRDNLRNRSLVVIASRFQQVLQKEVNVHKLISLSSLEDTKRILPICYGKKGDINTAFFEQLQETFSMLGLDVHSVSKDRLCIDSTSLKYSEVILCIISQSLSIEEFEGMLSNAAAHRPKVLYVSYGPHPTDESTSKPCFKLKVNFDKSELDKAEFKAMVNDVARSLNKGCEKIMEGQEHQATDFLPVGLTERVNELWAEMSNCLSNSSNAVRCFGLQGMGGTGKTTTAMSIYNKIHKQFEASFFCVNTRARVAAGASRLGSLRNEILDSLLSKKQRGKAHLSSRTMDPTRDEVHGKALFSSVLKGIYALLVLDDVDSKEQVDVLYSTLCSSLRANSVVLITSRDKEVLERAQPSRIFCMSELSRESSQRLFNWHAFLKPEAPPHLQEVSESVIAACKGLPLSLKVMGSHLYHKSDKRYWVESLNYLRKHQEDIFSVLKMSLDGLKSEQLDSFLDISCFFVGVNDVVSAAYVEGVYRVGWTHLNSLSSRCLLTFKTEKGAWGEEYCDIEDRTIEMHDQIRDMGRHIVREEKKNRAWDEETAQDLLKDETTRSALRGLSINGAMTLPCEAAKCESLPQLYFLRVIDDGNSSAGNVLKGVRCEELRLLVWRNAPFREVPPGLRSSKLRVLDLRDSKILELPPAPCFMELRYLDLGGTNISSVPHGISFANLEYMDLSRTKIEELPSGLQCPNLRRLFLSKTQISQVPHGLYSTNLEILDLSQTNIGNVPKARLPNLLVLDLKGCQWSSHSTKFHTSMTSLQLLNLSECNSLDGLDSSIQSLADLRRLMLRGCHLMTSLPHEMTKLSSLKLIDLRECTSLQTLSFLPATLEKLFLDDCSRLETVSASLPNLQQLHVSRCRNLRRLPTELGASMRVLYVERCYALHEMLATEQQSFFGDLSSLEDLDLRECTSLKTLSFLPTTLQSLWLNGCSSLQTVNASLPMLQKFYALKCSNLRRLPTELGTCMRELGLKACDGLSEWLATNHEELLSLEHLDLRECTSLETLFFLPTTMQTLWLSGCSSLQAVNGSLPKLQEFYAGKCSNLRTLPKELGGYMRELCLEGCEGLSEWLATNKASLLFGELSSLDHLDLRECTSLETLSLLPTTLQTLWLTGCSRLRTVNGSLPMLQKLYASKCSKLRTLPTELGTCMRELGLKACDGLSEWLATNQASLLFGELSSLEHLDLRECTSLETLPFLPTTLKTLWLTGCKSLQAVNGSLPKLQEFYAGECSNLRTLPKELGACMRELCLEGCDGLSEWLATDEASSLFGELSSLEHLDLKACTSLKTLSFLPTTLKTLWLNGCSNLQSVSASLPKLQQFYARKCSSLRTLPTELGACMRALGLEGCDGLSQWLATKNASLLFCELLSLEHLDLRECTSLETLPFLPTTMQTLWLTGCSRLQAVNGSLPKLQEFYAEKCSKLRTLPKELGACMRELCLKGCDGLSEWLATDEASLLFEELCSLKKLDLSWCINLKALSFLPTSLEELTLEGCIQLEVLRFGSGNLTNLKRLDIRYCASLRSLPQELESRSSRAYNQKR